MVRSLIFLFILLSTPTGSQTDFPALLADKPASAHKDKLMLFGQFAGTWSFGGIEYHDDGGRSTDKGEIHFQWVLQGKAIQDVWLETERSDSGPKIYGTTLRFYDPKTDSWRNTWIEPGLGVVTSLEGRKIGEEIVLLGETTGGTPIRWVFSEIRHNSFHWHGERKNGNEWRTYEELWAHRM